MKKKVHPDTVGSWGRSEVGSAPSSNLVRRWGKTCGQKMGQSGLKTGTPSSDQGLVGRWGRPVLRLGRSEDGAQHLQGSPLSPPSPYQISYWSDISEILVLFIGQLMSNLGTKTTQNMYDFEKSHLPHTVLMGGFLGQHFGKVAWTYKWYFLV